MRPLPLCLGLCSLFFVVAKADDTQIRPLKDGVALSVGGSQVELRAATPHAFRLHVSYGAEQSPTKSIFLSAEAQAPVAFSPLQTGSVVGIKTDAGELQVDTSSRQWRLCDSAGGKITDWAPLPAAANPPSPSSSLNMEVGPSTKSQNLFYGSGNVPTLGSLLQTEALSRAGNGNTSLPQYWCDAGYGALLITQNDNQPAQWKANPQGGVDWTGPGTTADLYLAPASNLYDWLRDQAELTGFAPVPPRWTFGYLQSRWAGRTKPTSRTRSFISATTICP